MISNVAWGVIAAAGVAAAGATVYVLRDPAPSPDVPVVEAPEERPETVVVEPEAAPEPAPEDVTTVEPTPEVPAEVKLPSLDVVRVDQNGGAIVAGSGPVASEVTLRLDGEEIATTRTDGQGNFVSLFDIPQMTVPQILTAEVQGDDGAILRATDSVIVAPTFPTAPEVAAAPEVDTSPATDEGEQIAQAPVEEQPVAEATVEETQTPEVVAALPEGDAPTEPLVEATSGPSVTAEAPTAPEPTDPDTTEVAALAAPEDTPQDAPAVVPAPEPETLTAAPDTSDAPEPSVTIPAPQIEVTRPAAPQVAAPDVTSPSAPTIQASVDVPSAPSAPRLFRAGPSGVTVISDGPSEAPTVVEDLGIDAISYDAAGDVQLTGRGQSDSELRIYLDNRPVLTVQVDADGAWSSPLPNVDTGIYTLRVDEVAVDGSVISRVETPFQRTAPEIAAQARRDGLTAITVQPGYTLWAISEGYFGSGVQYVQIFEANRSLIRDPDLIYPGQVFALPEDDASSQAN